LNNKGHKLDRNSHSLILLWFLYGMAFQIPPWLACM